MQKLLVKRYSPKLSSPVYVVGLSGPNEHGRAAARRLIDRAKANLFIEFYNHQFPDHVIVTEDGTCRLLRYEIYESALTSPNLLIACGDSEVNLENNGVGYEVFDQLVMLGMENGASSLILVDAAPFVEDVSDPICAVATRLGLTRNLERRGVRLIRDTHIPGAAGTILGICRRHRLDAVGIFSTRSDDVEAAADSLVEFIETHFSLNYPSQRSM
ncbi:PAC2 family protein [Candidatus Bathyarchaeota archaeon]|nr:PAC2 family protein [Candidatus Bathyarchaeota archaeon]